MALATALQFVGQLMGIAAPPRPTASAPCRCWLAQAALVLPGAIAVWRLPEPPPHPPVQHPGFWRSVGDGIAEAARSEQIWPVLLLNFGIGVFYVGPFMAVLPLVVRDVYPGGAAEIAYINLAFWAGTIIAAFAFAGLARRLTLRGRLVVSAVSVGSVILSAWRCSRRSWPSTRCASSGVGAGITLTQGRTVLQIVAPPTHRARLMSLFQLGLGGGSPIGAFIAGSLPAVLGPSSPWCCRRIAMVVLIGAVRCLAHLVDAHGGVGASLERGPPGPRANERYSAAARRPKPRLCQTSCRAATSRAMSSSLCSGVGVSRSRSVPRGTVG